ncbi:MAG: hypothetical protein O6650_08540, partial [Actinobacteria bacterium]|nr:hypothetical protein [Actinomycetota bacterium]
MSMKTLTGRLQQDRVGLYLVPARQETMGVRLARTATIERGKRNEAVEFAATISEYWKENFGVAVTWGVQV